MALTTLHSVASGTQDGDRPAVDLTPAERAWLEAHPEIRVAPTPDYAPTEFVDASGTWRGISADVFALLEERLGVRFTPVVLDHERMQLRDPVLMTADVVPLSAPTPDRREYWLFTEPYLEYPAVIIVRSGVEGPLDMRDLHGRHVAVVRGWALQAHLEEHHPEVVVVPVDDTAIGLRKVSFGSVDALLSDLPVASATIESERITNLRAAGETDFAYQMGISTRRDWPVLHGILEKGLASITPAQRREIVERWIRIRRPSILGRRGLLAGAMAVLGATFIGLAGALARNRFLQRTRSELERRVGERTALLESANVDLRREIEERIRATEALVRSERNLEYAQEIAGIATWELDRETGQVTCSPSYCALVGRSAVEGELAIGTFLESVHPIDRLRVREILYGPPDGSPSEVEHRIVRDDGEERWLFTRTSPFSDDVPHRILGISQDVTARKHEEAEHERQRTHLVEADKRIALGTLVAGVMHEINNPNQFILLNAALLRDAWRDALRILEHHHALDPDLRLANLPFEEMRDELPLVIDEVHQGAERIRAIVSELRGYAGRSSSTVMEAVSVDDVLRSALTLLASSIRKATGSFTVEHGEGVPAVHGNLRRLEQVVINLLINACQSLPDPSSAVVVTTSHDAASGTVVLTVRDEGCGIAADDLPHVTDPFFTRRRERGGTGLGLAVAVRIVGEHQGRLEFESTPGVGTTARVRLPVHVERPTPEEQVELTPAAPPAVRAPIPVRAPRREA